MDRISAFMDGESGQTETRQTMQRLKQDDECCETWATFHLIGDMMRGDPVLRDDFMTRFQTLMKDEPTQLAPRLTLRRSANFALSMAASVCAVSVVLMLVFTDNALSPLGQIATAPKVDETARARAEPPAPLVAAVKEGKVNEYLMAHQEFSPSTAFQGVAPYVRTVSEPRDGDGR
ncbi:unnamed protein product [Phaeothamnion confervicola]